MREASSTHLDQLHRYDLQDLGQSVRLSGKDLLKEAGHRSDQHRDDLDRCKPTYLTKKCDRGAEIRAP